MLRDRQTDTQTDIQKDKQTNRQTDRQTDIQVLGKTLPLSRGKKRLTEASCNHQATWQKCCRKVSALVQHWSCGRPRLYVHTTLTLCTSKYVSKQASTFIRIYLTFLFKYATYSCTNAARIVFARNLRHCFKVSHHGSTNRWDRITWSTKPWVFTPIV